MKGIELGNISQYFIFIILLIFFYFIHRITIFQFYREFLRYKFIKENKIYRNKFLKITGLYLFYVKKGQSIFLKLSLLLTNIQILFIPIIILLIINIIFREVYIKGSKFFLLIIVGYFQIIWLLLLLHYIFFIRFRKNKLF
jgi:hypothetical protein